MNAYQVYRQTQTQTAGPGELVLMLYRGAVRFVSAAVGAIDSGDIMLAHTNFVKAQAIVLELNTSLDQERGGEFARNLSAVYDYLHRRLVEANVTKDAAIAREVQSFLKQLLPAWEAAVKQTSGAPAGGLVGAGH